MVQVHLLHSDGRIEFGVSHALALEPPPETTIWVDIEGAGPNEQELLAKSWSFHPLAIEDSVSRQQRAKYERYPTHDFLVILALDQSTEEELDTIPICAFLRKRMIVTVHTRPVRVLNTIQERLKADQSSIGHLDRLVHLLLDATVDEFMPLLDRYEKDLDTLESLATVAAREQTMEELLFMRRELLLVRRILTPFQEVVRRYTDREHGEMAPECRLLFRDVHDHLLVLLDLVALRMEVCSGAIEAHAHATNERLNQVMKYLAVVSTLGLPMTIVSGIFGMNFEVIPITHHAWGFSFAVGMMAFLSIALLGWFRWRKWI